MIESPDVERVTTPVKPLRVGLMGCGTVSVQYLTNLMGSAEIDVVSCTDLLPERARARADQFGVSRVYSQDELFSAHDIELVVNLTVPDSHFDVSMGVLRSGKHVWTEKPLGVDREQGRALIQEAGERGLQIGCAPDTVLGAGLQTSRKLVDEGLIGEPLAAAAFMLSRGPESWHPDPVFLYQPGAGPLFDIGVYYVSALVNLLGPVSRVSAFGRLLFPERVIASGPRAGEAFSVGTDTFIAGILEFESGVLANLASAYGIWGAGLPKIQVYGSEGVLNVPDPNGFGGPVRANLHTDDLGWRELPLAYNHTDHCGNCRGLGVIEMAHALFEGRTPRASAALGYHVLDVMQSMTESAAGGGHVKVASTCARPSPLPAAAPVAEGAQ